MITVTLPKKLIARGDVVVLSRQDYDRFILAERKIKSRNTFTPDKDELSALARGRKNFRAKKYRQV